MGRIDAGTDLCNAEKGADEQELRHQQHDGRRHFDHDHRVPQAEASGDARTRRAMHPSVR